MAKRVGICIGLFLEAFNIHSLTPTHSLSYVSEPVAGRPRFDTGVIDIITTSSLSPMESPMMAAPTPQRAFPVLPSKTVVMHSPKYLLPSSGPFSHPRRPAEPCKICHVAIELEDTALTHTLSPCHTSFHAECLLEWLPYASITPLEHGAGNGPSCPNCRQALGKCSTTVEKKVELDATSRLPGFAYPVETMDELRAIVGNEVFMRRRLADRHYAVPVSYNEIPVENPDPDSLTEDFGSELHESEDGLLDLWQELNTYRVPDARQEIERLMFAFTPVSNTDTAAPHSPNAPIPASAVHDLLDALHATKGVTHYSAYVFPESGYSNTTFYVPIYPWFNVMQWYDGHDDRYWAGQWLRGPLIHSLEETRANVRHYGQLNAESDLEEVVDSVNRIEQITLEGFAFWLPCDVCDNNGRGEVYAVPWVSMDVSDLPGREEGEIACGFFRNDSLSYELHDNAVDRQYWASCFDEDLCNRGPAIPTLRDFMGPEANRPWRDMHSLTLNDLLTWEVMNATPNELTTVTGDRHFEEIFVPAAENSAAFASDPTSEHLLPQMLNPPDGVEVVRSLSYGYEALLLPSLEDADSVSAQQASAIQALISSDNIASHVAHCPCLGCLY